MIKETKDRKKVYAWLAEGRVVQVNINGWTSCSEEGLLRHLLSGSSHTYRLEENICFGSYKAPRPIYMQVVETNRHVGFDTPAGELTIAIRADTHQTVYEIQRAICNYIEDFGLAP